MSEEGSAQVSVNLPQRLWERLQADARGAGQAIIDALEAHLPPAQAAPVEVPAAQSVGNQADVQLNTPTASETVAPAATIEPAAPVQTS